MTKEEVRIKKFAEEVSFRNSIQDERRKAQEDYLRVCSKRCEARRNDPIVEQQELWRC